MTEVLLSIIVPTLNEAAVIRRSLLALQALRDHGCELIVVDGGSDDDTVMQARPLADQVIESEAGRALQMNVGAARASGRWLLFLHADTQLPDNLRKWLRFITGQKTGWGFFTVRLSGDHSYFRLIETAMNWRSRLSSVATGDQCLFVDKTLFFGCGAYPQIPLMEDVAISKRLRRYHKPCCWQQPVLTSSRRWEKNGIIRTVLLMWRLRLAYFLGVSAERLAKSYHG